MYIPEDYNVFEDDPDYECNRRMEQIAHIYEEFGLKYYGEQLGRHVYRGDDGYYRIDRLTLPDDGPYAVLEYNEVEGFAYEDSGLIRFDAHPDDVYNEVCCVLGYPHSINIIPGKYNSYMGRKVPDEICDTLSSRRILHMSDNYILYCEYEHAYLYNLSTGEQISLGFYYGDPDMGLIDKNEEFCAVYGDVLNIYFIKSVTSITINTPNEWGYYMRQVSDDCFEIRFANNPKYVINVKNVRDGESIEEHRSL